MHSRYEGSLDRICTALAQTLDRGSDLRRADRKKRLVAESTIEALRAWNDATELEKCPREDSFVEMFQLLGDAEALDEVRKNNKNKSHCAWLRKDSSACECLPEGEYGKLEDGTIIQAGMVCPHNAYAHHPEVFQSRDGVMDTIERLFRLVNSAESGIKLDLDIFSVTELLSAKSELERQQAKKQENERLRMEAQSNKGKGLPSWESD